MLQLLVGLIMAVQVGVQSGARIGIHNHTTITQGGILYWAHRTPYRTGALAVNSPNDTERSLTAVGVFTLMKEILINAAQAGRYRIQWEMRNSDNISNVRSRFYVNGVAVGAIQTNATNAYQQKTHNYDVDLATGDRLQIYGDPLGDFVWIRNFRIYYDWGLERFSIDGTSRVLATLLPLTDVDLLDYTSVV